VIQISRAATQQIEYDRAFSGAEMSERLNVGRLFDPAAFLETTAKGRTVVAYRKGAVLFGQGDAADAVFYVKSGKVKVTVVSAHARKPS
jgi:CRP/FNR family cyclic AMP-dependent transcriptional regulator